MNKKVTANNLLVHIVRIIICASLSGCSTLLPSTNSAVSRSSEQPTSMVATTNTPSPLPSPTITSTAKPVKISIHNIDQLKILNRYIASPPDQGIGMVISPDNTYLAASIGTRVALIDPVSMTEVLSFESPQQSHVRELKFNPEGNYLAAFNDLGAIDDNKPELIVYEMGDSPRTSILPSRLEDVEQWGGFEFSPDDTKLVAWGMSRTLSSMFIEVWDLNSSNLEKSLIGECYDVSFSADGAFLICSNKNQLRFIDTSTWQDSFLYMPYNVGPLSMDGANQENIIVSCIDNGNLREVTINLVTRMIVNDILIDPPRNMNSILSPDATIFINFDFLRSTIHVYDSATSNLLRVIDFPGYQIRDVLFSPDQSSIYLSTWESQIFQMGY